MDQETRLREFLKTVPEEYDHVIIAESAKRVVKRRINAGRHEVLRQCKFCTEFYGARKMRLHVAEAHPGGKREHEPHNRNPEVPRTCLYCPSVLGARRMVEHVREAHPEQVSRKNRKPKEAS